MVGKHQPGENHYVMLYRGGNTKFTWKKELQQYVPYQFRVQVRTTEGVGNWSSPVTAFRAEPGDLIGLLLVSFSVCIVCKNRISDVRRDALCEK